MSKRKKLTKAEAGRLGGKATVKRYGPEHMRTIGKAGFQAFARKLGFMGGSRLGAIRWLQRQKKFRTETPAEQAQAQAMFEDLWNQLAPNDEPEEDPLIAQILASIRSAPIPADGGL
jgi:hypothetical protein